MLYQIIDIAIQKTGSSKALAMELEISPSEITRFRSGESGFKIQKLNKLLEISGLEVIEKDERQKLIDSALLFADLYKNKR